MSIESKLRQLPDPLRQPPERTDSGAAAAAADLAEATNPAAAAMAQGDFSTPQQPCLSAAMVSVLNRASIRSQQVAKPIKRASTVNTHLAEDFPVSA